jgi:hypothetical protein
METGGSSSDLGTGNGRTTLDKLKGAFSGYHPSLFDTEPIVDRADRMTISEADKRWNEAYTTFNIKGDSNKMFFKIAVIDYCVFNGTSPKSTFQKPDGTDLLIAGQFGDPVLARTFASIIGERALRQFAMTFADEAMLRCKHNKTVATMMKDSHKHGYWYLCFDFSSGCTGLTAEEVDFVAALKRYKTDDALAKNIDHEVQKTLDFAEPGASVALTPTRTPTNMFRTSGRQ